MIRLQWDRQLWKSTVAPQYYVFVSFFFPRSSNTKTIMKTSGGFQTFFGDKSTSPRTREGGRGTFACSDVVAETFEIKRSRVIIFFPHKYYYYTPVVYVLRVKQYNGIPKTVCALVRNWTRSNWTFLARGEQ